jgi:hypothetical protein
MPKKNMSLDTGLTRYHRIGSPTDAIRVLTDRPIECALCHTDKSVNELAHAMETWWHKAYDADALQSLYGDGGSNVLVATLERGKPHEKAVALSVLSSGASRRDLAPLFARELADEYPLVREFARVALLATLSSKTEKSCDLSMYAEVGRLELDAEACLRAAGLPPPTWGPSSGGGASGPTQAEPSED